MWGHQLTWLKDYIIIIMKNKEFEIIWSFKRAINFKLEILEYTTKKDLLIREQKMD